ncbi:hypothetical protein CLAIMM_00577, partial [Cladophialophora immunda]
MSHSVLHQRLGSHATYQRNMTFVYERSSLSMNDMTQRITFECFVQEHLNRLNDVTLSTATFVKCAEDHVHHQPPLVPLRKSPTTSLARIHSLILVAISGAPGYELRISYKVHLCLSARPG